MRIVGILVSLVLIIMMLVEAFETILQSRRVTHRFRYVRLYYAGMWLLWRAVALWLPPGRRRESFLSVFAPLSLLGLFGNWVLGLILGFALLHWSLGQPLNPGRIAPTFPGCLYLSGTTFFTLGYGDITPASAIGHFLAVVEAGMGFAFLAVLVSYLPVLFQAYSRREVTISLLDARAGSPPSAGQLLSRLARTSKPSAADAFLREWEQWAAELLESHLSFPVLSYYRSQHDNQSWLATLTMILDACALLLTKVKGGDHHQAQLTFAMARHAAVDLGLVLKIRPLPPDRDRLEPPLRQRIEQQLRDAGLDLIDGAEADAKLASVRGMYEPFVNALGNRLLFTMPEIWPEQPTPDNWQRAPKVAEAPAAKADGQHFG